MLSAALLDKDCNEIQVDDYDSNTVCNIFKSMDGKPLNIKSRNDCLNLYKLSHQWDCKTIEEITFDMLIDKYKITIEILEALKCRNCPRYKEAVKKFVDKKYDTDCGVVNDIIDEYKQETERVKSVNYKNYTEKLKLEVILKNCIVKLGFLRTDCKTCIYKRYSEYFLEEMQSIISGLYRGVYN